MVRAMQYEPLLPLWPHQQTAIERMQGKKVFALFMAMRTGKTATILADFGQLELDQQAQDLCVIAPAGVYKTWSTTLDDHLSVDLRSRIKVHVWKSGKAAREKNLRKEFLQHTSGPRMLLINCEAFSGISSHARNFATAFLSQRTSYVAIDESTIIKNRSKRTRYINRYIKPLATYRRILSGLPTPRSPLDLYFQFEFLDLGILGYGSFLAFRNRYAIMKMIPVGGRSIQIVVGYQKGATEALAKLIEPYSYRVPFRPNVPSAWTFREVDLTAEQARAYKEIKDYATTKLDNESHVTANAVISQMMRMHQVLCGHVKDETGDFHTLPENRTAALLEELADYGGKAIIWFTYIHDLEKCSAALEKEYGKGSTARFYGNNAGTREDDELRFKADDRCRFMLATAGAGGRGRTWSNADRVIYYSNSDNLEHREQSEQRSLGMDKVEGVDYVDLVVPDSIDMKILHALRNKINMSTAINGDNYREWLL